jgi:hypothetical protein
MGEHVWCATLERETMPAWHRADLILSIVAARLHNNGSVYWRAITKGRLT